MAKDVLSYEELHKKQLRIEYFDNPEKNDFQFSVDYVY
jgi:hypothetical protein